jgi:oligopeptide/dipeptide ABC transporter ATP-binding protein
MIAMALACKPALLIADEPTTALDVTVQAQILELMLELQESVGMAIQFISHDLGVISEIADDVAVMYAGRIVEQAPAERLFEAPRHPYTRGLLATLPRVGARVGRLPAITGAVPDLADLPSGCAFRDRCPNAIADCAARPPRLGEVAPGHQVACYAPAAP